MIENIYETFKAPSKALDFAHALERYMVAGSTVVFLVSKAASGPLHYHVEANYVKEEAQHDLMISKYLTTTHGEL